MDNKLLNVNGKGEDLLAMALKFAFNQDGYRESTCSSWEQSKTHGLILYAYHSDSSDRPINDFPSKLTADQCLPIIQSWLSGEFAETVELSPWCDDCDHDGHNGKGWQVYLEDWGHVDNQWGVICAVKPAFMWYGK